MHRPSTFSIVLILSVMLSVYASDTYADDFTSYFVVQGGGPLTNIHSEDKPSACLAIIGLPNQNGNRVVVDAVHNDGTDMCDVELDNGALRDWPYQETLNNCPGTTVFNFGTQVCDDAPPPDVIFNDELEALTEIYRMLFAFVGFGLVAIGFNTAWSMQKR